MRVVIFGLMLLGSVCVQASDIQVGDVQITIPSPEGFSPVTPEMAPLFEMQKHFVPASNQEFVAFIAEENVPIAMAGDIPEMPRRFTVQTPKDLVGSFITSADFLEIKTVIKTQNDEIFKKVEQQLPGFSSQVSHGIKQQFDVDLALSISKMLPMPIHLETERAFAYSSFVKYDVKDEQGNTTPFVVVTTATIVHIKGKLLFLYTYAEESGLDWSKDAAKQWAEAVIAANPSDPQTATKEAQTPSAVNIDWNQVGEKAIVGGVIGGIIALFSVLLRRFRPQKK